MTKTLSLAAAVLLLPLAASAADVVRQKPGLWANTVKINLGEGMPQIDPMMLEQMRQMGLQIPIVEPVTQQICLTAAQVAKDRLPDMNDPDSGCGARNVQRQGNQITGELMCDGDLRGSGRMQMQIDSAERYSGTSSFIGTQSGAPVNMTMQFSGQWLGADCGTVKPFEG